MKTKANPDSYFRIGCAAFQLVCVFLNAFFVIFSYHSFSLGTIMTFSLAQLIDVLCEKRKWSRSI